MKILDAAQTRACESLAIQRLQIEEGALMERAAVGCADWIKAHYPQDTPFIIFCGMGNNGGDGLAIARLLHLGGFAVQPYILKHKRTFAPQTEIQLQQLRAAGISELYIDEHSTITELPDNIVLIDAILGAGAARPLDGWLLSLVQALNKLNNEVLAIDIPTGLHEEELPIENEIVFEATHTLVIQQYKRSMLHPEGGKHTGMLHRISIGLEELFSEEDCAYNTVEESLTRALYKPRDSFSHKGSHGTALIVGGSRGMMGAATLAARAAGRAGAGKVRSMVPGCGYDIMQTLVPEAMCSTSGTDAVEEISGWEAATAIGLGMGMGTDGHQQKVLNQFLKENDKPLVLDADAINMLAQDETLLSMLKPGTILTPHPKEFERMAGNTASSMERIALGRSFARKHQVVLVLKDRYTCIITPQGNCYYNIRGNAGLATGGSGDVLAGIITGLLAQQYQPFAAAVLGVYLHAVAGELAVDEQSMESIVAGDIPEYIGKAFRAISR